MSFKNPSKHKLRTFTQRRKDAMNAQSKTSMRILCTSAAWLALFLLAAPVLLAQDFERVVEGLSIERDGLKALWQLLPAHRRVPG